MMKYIFIGVVLLISLPVGAGSVDLTISSSFVEDDMLIRGERVKFSITITNNGPDVAGGDSTASNPVRVTTSGIELDMDGMDVIFFLDNSLSQDCEIRAVIAEPLPGNFPALIYGFTHPPIPVNESVTCYVEFQIFNPTEIVLRVSSSQDTDPDITNNSQTMIFGLRPVQVSVNSVVTILTLIGLLLLFGFNHLRRNG